jgi:hypothetical protein
MKSPALVQCPTCRRPGHWLDTPHLPFCSARCKLIDLGGWLSERHVIASPLRPEHLEAYSELPPGSELDQPETERG